MSYVKLDASILTSTLWLDRDARDLFITALLLARPAKFDEPVETLRPDSLEPTGWTLPSGEYGFAETSGPGLIRLAVLDPDAGMAALTRLCAPDPESRTRDYEGRRLARVPGGYVVLNYMLYRNKDHTNAIRQRQYRKRKKQGDALTQSDECCECCKEPFGEPYSKYAVRDHDHKTGQLRGLICQSCNKVIGLIEAGKPTKSPKAELAKAYLKIYRVTQHVTQAEEDTEEDIDNLSTVSDGGNITTSGEKEKKRISTVERKNSHSGEEDYEVEFELWWGEYPKRAGGNPRKAAYQAYVARRKAGVSAQELLDGVRRYRRYCEARGIIGTEFVKQAQFWLSPRYEGWIQDWTAEEQWSSLGIPDDKFIDG